MEPLPLAAIVPVPAAEQQTPADHAEEWLGPEEWQDDVDTTVLDVGGAPPGPPSVWVYPGFKARFSAVAVTMLGLTDGHFRLLTSNRGRVAVWPVAANDRQSLAPVCYLDADGWIHPASKLRAVFKGCRGRYLLVGPDETGKFVLEKKENAAASTTENP